MSRDLFQILKSADIWSESIPLKRSEYLGNSGTTDQNVYWVEEGVLRISSTDAEREYGMRFAYSGELFSRLDSYIKAVPSRYQVQALRKTNLRAATKVDFEHTLKRHEGLSELWQEGLYQLIYDMLEREDDLMINDPQLRLNRVLKRSPRLFQEVPHKYIASYLRMSPETLSRLLNS